jgi:tRNA A-37 threonylcarbamoyl transferase component Bud32
VPSVLFARFEKRLEVAPIARAAIDGEIVYVALAQAPGAGRHELTLYAGDEVVGVVSAELVGSGRDGHYPLRMRLLDEAHAVELERLAGGYAVAPSPSSGPPDAFGDEPGTLVSRSGLRLRTPPPPSSRVSEVPSEVKDVATSPFDPDKPMRGLHDSDSDSDPDGLFPDDESQTLPGSSRAPGSPTEVSWNERIEPTTQDPLCGRTIGGGKYVLDSVIGTGAIGIVFKASHRDLGRTVAIKVLNPRYRDDPELLAVFRTEARAASQLEHPNVARVYDYGQEPDGLVYLVMEYLSGYTLGSVLAVRRKLTAARAIDLMIQVCAALSAAHDRAIVHRDVKPDNIVLVPAQDDEGDPVEIVKVCDFGIAALATTRTDEGPVAGTPEYMAPEQTTGSAVTPSADLYACGVVLYQMLTGEVPFTSDQAYRILMKHRDEAPRPPSSIEPAIPSALEAIILRCMAKSPASRFQSARELRVELRKIEGKRA